MVLVIGGHPRSGTTMLKNLCDDHPEMVITFEFHSFTHLNQSVATYRKSLRKNWYRRPILGHRGLSPRLRKLKSAVFFYRYMASFFGPAHEVVTLDQVEQAYRRQYPQAKLVGDKYPRYVFKLEQLAGYSNMKRVMIYRDPRDVARSALEKVGGDWRGQKFAERFDNAEKITRSWIKAMENIQRFQSQIFSIKYEDLTRDPERVLAGLSGYLGVDTGGFRPKIVKSDRVGKFQHGLFAKDIHTIEEIAGSWMEAYGYL